MQDQNKPVVETVNTFSPPSAIPPSVRLENLIDPAIDSFATEAPPELIQAIRYAIEALKRPVHPSLPNLLAERNALAERLNAVVEERNKAERKLQGEKREHALMEQELHKCIAHLKGRKAYYKGKVQKCGIVLNAANLLNVGAVAVDVLADALADDPAERLEHPERFGD